jgi:hypothetical protein
MPDLTTDHVVALAAAAGVPLLPDDVVEVTHRLNALLDALAPLADLPLETVEPLASLPDPVESA